ncbi:MAG: tetratricopeptide repeat protein [Candidatus Odinarchaeota archaeon]
MNPESIEVLNNKALMSIKHNKFGTALKYIKKVLKINPENIVALNNQGVVFTRLGKYEKALRCYDLVLSIDPNYKKTQINREKLLVKIRDSPTRHGLSISDLSIIGNVIGILSWILLYIYLLYFGFIYFAKTAIFIGALEIIAALLILPSSLKPNQKKKIIRILKFIYSLILLILGIWCIIFAMI